MTWGVEKISVRYGHVTAVDGISMTIEPGAIHAIIGGDGAGKSTLLKVLAGLDLGQTGRVTLPAQEQIGFVPSEGGIFRELTVNENMEFVAGAYLLTGWAERATMLLERASLDAFGDRISGKMSGGQRRKLAGSMALLPQPRLLLLDEVTTGVDPVSRMELWRLMASAAASGAAVIAATTYLDEAERASSVLLMHQGRVLAAGSPEQIKAEVPGSVSNVDEPTRRSLAWRSGRRWRQWDPDQTGSRSATITLEDAAIVFELNQQQTAR